MAGKRLNENRRARRGKATTSRLALDALENRFRAHAESSGLAEQLRVKPPFPNGEGFLSVPWPDRAYRAFPLIGLVRGIHSRQGWMASLPGFFEAVTSAERAAVRHLASLPGMAEILAASPQERTRTWRLLRLGLLPPGPEREAEVVALTAGAGAEMATVLKAAAERVRNADRASRKLADGRVCAVVGRSETGYQGALACLWIEQGFWLAEAPDIAARLTIASARMDGQPMKGPFGPLPDVEPVTVRGWISKLGLAHYPGRGRLTYSGSGLATIDDALWREMHAAGVDCRSVGR